jgi:hypothetical protein
MDVSKIFNNKNVVCVTSNNEFVRRLLPFDWEGIKRIAEDSGGFTVPSAYVVWMLSCAQKDLCLVALDAENNIIGYVFGMRCDLQDEVFIWQLGVASMPLKARYRVSSLLINSLFRKLKKKDIRSVIFSTSRDKVNFIRHTLMGEGYVDADFIINVEIRWVVPTEGELMFRVKVK